MEQDLMSCAISQWKQGEKSISLRGGGKHTKVSQEKRRKSRQSRKRMKRRKRRRCFCSFLSYDKKSILFSPAGFFSSFTTSLSPPRRAQTDGEGHLRMER